MYDQPVFVLNTDIDWASEYCIDFFLDVCRDQGIVSTAFVTHESPVLKAAATRGEVELGLHPNFNPGSDHGETREEVIDYVFDLVPDAKCYRSHAMYDDSYLAMEMSRRGILYDSNIALYLQANLIPLHHWIGIPRFPIFWEDDHHWRRGKSWRFEDYEKAFFTPGLKIINPHPLMFSLNLADHETYSRVKGLAKTLTAQDIAKLEQPGRGTRTFVMEVIEAVEKRGLRFHTLDELYEAYPKETIY